MHPISFASYSFLGSKDC